MENNNSWTESFLESTTAFFLLIAIVLSVVGPAYWNHHSSYALNFFIFIVLSCGLLFASLRKIVSSKPNKHVELDVVSLFFILIILNIVLRCVFEGGRTSFDLMLKMGISTTAYLIISLSKSSKIIILLLSGFVIIGFIESLLVLLQNYNVSPTISGTFSATGTFTNPAHAAMLISLSLAILVSKIRYIRTRGAIRGLLIVLLICTMFTMIAAIVILSCRASIFGLSCTLYFYFTRHLPSKFRYPIAIILVIGLLCALYFMKPLSALARVLIWSSTLEGMIPQNMFLGRGPESFQSDYMFLQEGYFIKHPLSPLAIVANNNYQTFNEYLHMLYEYGIVGLLLFLALLYFVLKVRDWNTYLPFMLLCVAMSFLYVFDITVLLISFACIIASAARKALVISIPSCCHYKSLVTQRATFGCILLISTIGLLLYSIVSLKRMTVASDSLYSARYSGEVSSIAGLIENEQLLTGERDLALVYAQILAQDNTDASRRTVWHIATHTVCTYEMLLDLGDSYLRIGDFSTAETLYCHAEIMIPSMISAKENLFNIYMREGCHEKACIYAKKILNDPVKVVGGKVLRARNAAREYLGQNNCDNKK